MDLLISFVNQTFTPGLTLGILRKTGEFAWIQNEVINNSSGITGLATKNGLIYVAFQNNGIGVLNNNLDIIQHFSSNAIKDPHSICIDNDNLFVISTGKNSVYKLEIKKGGLLANEELVWTHPDVDTDYDYVHLNSIVASGKNTFVSLFGVREKGQNWSAVSNGKVININTNEIVLENINHPHSLTKQSESGFIVCESKTGSILDQNGKPLIKLPGYVRGICKRDKMYIVATSARRKLSKTILKNYSGRIREYENNKNTRSKLYFLSNKKFKNFTFEF